MFDEHLELQLSHKDGGRTPLFSLSFLPLIHVTKRNVYTGVGAKGPDDPSFFVVVPLVFLAKSRKAAGIDDSHVHHQRSLASHYIFPHCMQLACQRLVRRLSSLKSSFESDLRS